MTEAIYQKRRQRVFFVAVGDVSWHSRDAQYFGCYAVSGFFVYVVWAANPMIVAVGVLPYPVTFMCTDLISELFGEEKARDMVLVGLLLNVWVVFLVMAGQCVAGAGVDPATGLRSSMLLDVNLCFSKSKTPHLVLWLLQWLPT